jgi:hypothetical protein
MTHWIPGLNTGGIVIAVRGMSMDNHNFHGGDSNAREDQGRGCATNSNA